MDYMEQVGIKWTKQEVSSDVFFRQYYHYDYNLSETERIGHVFVVPQATSTPYDPYQYWHSSNIGTYYNPTGVKDSRAHPLVFLEEDESTLDELLYEMHILDPFDDETYMNLWKNYQLRWQKVLPALPIFSVSRHVIYHGQLKNVEVNANWHWSKQIVYMTCEA